MSEIEREDILAQRLEDMQRKQDKWNLDQMLKAQSSGVDADSVSKAAKRELLRDILRALPAVA
jgi:RNA polymerase-associated protein RTF1